MFRATSLFLLVVLIIPSSPALALEDSKTAEEEYIERSEKASEWLFKTFPRHIASDLAHNFEPLPLLIWTSGFWTAGLSTAADGEVQDAFSSNNVMGGSRKIFDHLGAFYGLGGITAFTIASGLIFKNKKLLLLGEVFAESLIVSQATTLALKYGVKRNRPDGSNNRSFPSGHTSGTFALATGVMSVYGPWYGIPAYMFATTMGISRLDANKHYLSDVVLGAALGTAMALGTARFHKKEKSSLFVYPQVGSRTIGLGASYSF